MQKTVVTLKPYIEELKAIYASIPRFQCIKDCTDCCGPIFMTGLERFLIRKPGRHTGATSCPWRTNGGCGIYALRPLVCRLFGAVNDQRLTCGFGCSPVFLLEDEQARSMLIEAQKISEAAGFPQMYNSHEATNRYILSPTKMPMQLPKYSFRD